MRNDHLRVGLGSQSTRLEKRLPVPCTTSINIKTSFDVIHSINYEIESLPEIIIENLFSRISYKVFKRFYIEIRVYLFCNSTGNTALRISYIIFAEYFLSVQVRYLNVLIISDSNLAFSRATDTHKSECLEILAPEGTSTYHESIDIG
jgi:hypothetical protein